jgi:hypothetical protein
LIFSFCSLVSKAQEVDFSSFTSALNSCLFSFIFSLFCSISSFFSSLNFSSSCFLSKAPLKKVAQEKLPPLKLLNSNFFFSIFSFIFFILSSEILPLEVVQALTQVRESVVSSAKTELNTKKLKKSPERIYFNFFINKY